jgi:hypothetical protein
MMDKKNVDKMATYFEVLSHLPDNHKIQWIIDAPAEVQTEHHPNEKSAVA